MKVLLVEDNKGDQIIFQEALREAGVTWDLKVLEDGVQAIDYLKRRNEFKDSLMPHLVILDLNLPRKNGREVLAEIRRSARLRHILVLILSHSGAAADICASYRLKANLYMKKPSGFHGFVQFAKMMKSWEDLVHYCTHSMP